MFRYPIILAAACVLFTCATGAEAKRYYIKRDPETGRTKVVDPTESTLSRITKPIFGPIVRPVVKAKNFIVGREPGKQAKGQLKGFGGPVYQTGMQQPTGMRPKAVGVATRTVDAAGALVGGQTGKDAVGHLTRPVHKALGGSHPQSAKKGSGF